MRLNRVNFCKEVSSRYRALLQLSCQGKENMPNAVVAECRIKPWCWPNSRVHRHLCLPQKEAYEGAITRHVNKLQKARCFTTSALKCMAGHSHWANIKFKKMHKDVERSKKFGKLSLEIISAVKENGADPVTNSKLDGIISRAKAVKMPKDSIESAIKSALRAGAEAQAQFLLEVRGPGRCGLLLDILSSNIKRTKPEIITILKKNGGILSEEGSVSFMFQHKGVVTVEDVIDDENNRNKAEDMAILSGAEDFFFDNDEDGKSMLRILCAPLDLGNVKESVASDHDMRISSANDEHIAVKLVDLDENQMTQADRLIDLLNSHHDVMRIFDNIKHYPSSTLKRDVIL